MTLLCACDGVLAEGPTVLEENGDGGPPAWKTRFECARCGRSYVRYRIETLKVVDGRVQRVSERVVWVGGEPRRA